MWVFKFPSGIIFLLIGKYSSTTIEHVFFNIIVQIWKVITINYEVDNIWRIECITTIIQSLEAEILEYAVVSHIMHEVVKYHFKVGSDKLKTYTIMPRTNTKINNSHSWWPKKEKKSWLIFIPKDAEKWKK